MPSTVSALCISHTSRRWTSDHLCPFALWTAFPSSLAGRDSCDYYGHSVAIGLAPRRRSRVRLRRTSRARRRRPTHLLDCPHWASLRAPEVAPGLTVHAGAERGIGFRRLSDGCALSPLEIGLQAIQLSPYRAGLAARRPGRLQTTTAFLACSCPLAFRVQVSQRTQESPPSSSRLRRGYNRAPHGAPGS